MRILVLHQHYWPEIAATAQILADICEDLSAAGHEVTVICGQPSYRVTDRGPKLPQLQTHKGVRINRVWSYTPATRTIPHRLAHYGSFFATSLVAAARRANADVSLVMSTPPLLLGVTGVLLRAALQVPFVYSVQDLYPDIAVDLGVLPQRGLLTSVVGTVATTSYWAAAATVTLSPAMARKLVARGVPADRVHVIPNWADTASVRPSARDNAFAVEHGVAYDFVVLYSGNLGQSQGLEHVLDAARLITDAPITFLFVGDGNAREGLERRSRELALRNVRFLPPQPREALSELLGSCDLGLVTMKKGVGDDLVPSKLYGIMAAARPVLASVEEGSEVARVVSAHNCGVVTPAENGAALADAIRRLHAAGAESRRVLGENGRRACSDLYARRVRTRQYEAVLRGVVEGRQPNATRPATSRLADPATLAEP